MAYVDLRYMNNQQKTLCNCFETKQQTTANNFTCKTAAFALLESRLTSATSHLSLAICAFNSALFLAMVWHFRCDDLAEVITRRIFWLVILVCVVNDRWSIFFFFTLTPGAVTGGSVRSNLVRECIKSEDGPEVVFVDGTDDICRSMSSSRSAARRAWKCFLPALKIVFFYRPFLEIRFDWSDSYARPVGRRQALNIVSHFFSLGSVHVPEHLSVSRCGGRHHVLWIVWKHWWHSIRFQSFYLSSRLIVSWSKVHTLGAKLHCQHLPPRPALLIC